jgi:hypothetical protein
MQFKKFYYALTASHFYPTNFGLYLSLICTNLRHEWHAVVLCLAPARLDEEQLGFSDQCLINDDI